MARRPSQTQKGRPGGNANMTFREGVDVWARWRIYRSVMGLLKSFLRRSALTWPLQRERIRLNVGTPNERVANNINQKNKTRGTGCGAVLGTRELFQKPEENSTHPVSANCPYNSKLAAMWMWVRLFFAVPLPVYEQKPPQPPAHPLGKPRWWRWMEICSKIMASTGHNPLKLKFPNVVAMFLRWGSKYHSSSNRWPREVSIENDSTGRVDQQSWQ